MIRKKLGDAKSRVESVIRVEEWKVSESAAT